VAIEVYAWLAMAKLILLLTTGLLAQTSTSWVDAVLDWNETALQHQEKGRFREAHEAYKRAIEAAESASVTPATRLRLQLNLASLHLEEGAYASAEQLIRAAEGRAQEIPFDSPELAALYNVTGSLRLIDGRLSLAQRMFEKALTILESPGVRDKSELASVLLNIGSVQMRQGRYAEARRNLDRSIALLKEVAETPRSHLVRALASRSTLEYLAKNWAGAEKDAAQALAMAETQYGSESPIVGELLQNYSLILDRLRRGKEARSYRSRARTLMSNKQSAFRPLIDITELGADRPAVRTK
jgi:tetratricopeptide (TPR) repeat protein